MKIAGYQPVTLLDYPGKIATIAFAHGCVFMCPYCHNKELVVEKLSENKSEEFLEFLQKRKGKLEGVVVSGGEPLMQDATLPFLQKIKEMRYLVKLDTNGQFSYRLKMILRNKLVDYIAMDIKTSEERYIEMTYNRSVFSEFSRIEKILCLAHMEQKNLCLINNIKGSIDLIMNSGIDYEFRITCANPLLKHKEFESIGKMICGAKRVYLQNYVESENVLDPEGLSPFTMEQLEEAKSILLDCGVQYVEIRGV